MSLAKAAEALNKFLRRTDDGQVPPLHCSISSSYHPYDNVVNTSKSRKEDDSPKICICKNSLTDDEIHNKETIATTPKDLNTIPSLRVASPSPLGQESSGLASLSISGNFSTANLLPFFGQILGLESSPLGLDLSSIKGFDIEEFTPLDPTKYKTELCRSYQVHGYCKYGTRCNYAHGLTQLRVAFRHGKYKTRNCQSYHKTGCCRYGARCSFIHDAEEGILKCPITEREALEALHYRPMNELHHIATITWRMMDGEPKFPPTEVHFFTPALHRTISESSLDQTWSKPYRKVIDALVPNEETNQLVNYTERSNKETNRPLSNEVEDNSPESNSDVSTDTVCSATSEAVDENEDPQQTKESPAATVDVHIESAFDSTQEDNSCQILNNENTQKINQCKEESDANTSSSKEPNSSINEPDMPKAKLKTLTTSTEKTRNWVSTRKPRSYKAVCSSSRPRKDLNNVETLSTFRLNDFLKCLKAKDGKRSWSWTQGMDRRRSSDSSLSSTRSFSPKRGRDMSKYKTELCRSYQYNRFCEYKEACLYAHGTKDLRSYPKHPLYRTKQCFSFHKKGFCLYGSRCQFLHDAESPSLP